MEDEHPEKIAKGKPYGALENQVDFYTLNAAFRQIKNCVVLFSLNRHLTISCCSCRNGLKINHIFQRSVVYEFFVNRCPFRSEIV